MVRMSLTLALSASLALVAPGCGDDHDHDHDDEHELEEDACTHFANGPIKAVTAGADMASAPDATAEHTRLDITLADGGDGTFEGVVSIVIDEAGDHAFFMSAAATATLFDATGAVVAAEESMGQSTVCQAIAAGQVVELAVGTYTLEISGASAALVQVVYFGAGGHDH